MPDLVPVPASTLAAPEPDLRPIRLVLQAWLSQYSVNTRRTYLTALDDLRAFTRSASVELMAFKLFALAKPAAATILLGWRDDMGRVRGLAPRSCNARMAAIRSLLAAARDYDLCTWSIRLRDFKVKGIRDTRGPGLEVFAKMWRESERFGDRDCRRRNRAILRLLYDLALRCSEVVSLDLCHLDLAQARLWVLGKGQVERQPMTLPKQTMLALLEWIDQRGNWPGPLFTSQSNGSRNHRIRRETVYTMIRDLGAAVGVKVWPHAIRHTSITEAVKRTSVQDAQRHARHRSIVTTMGYYDAEQDVGGAVAKKLARTLDEKVDGKWAGDVAAKKIRSMMRKAR